MLRVKIINRSQDFFNIRTAWNSLLSESNADTIFLTWEWLYVWWESYSKEKELYILLFHDNNGDLIGIAPFYIAYEKIMGIPIRILKLIGSEEVCAEYLDVIARRDKKDDIIMTLINYLEDSYVNCDIFYFNDFSECCIINEVLAQLRERRSVNYENIIQTTNPFIALSKEENLFIADLKKNKKSAAKLADIIRRRKKLEKEHEMSIHTENNYSEEAFDNFVNLHQKLWESRKLPGVFRRSSFLQFHKNIAKIFAENDWLQLSFLLVKGKPIASLYGFQYKDKFYYYQSGFDPEWKNYGVGKILIYHTICEAIKSGLNEYDFLRGDTDYKFDFTDKFRHTKKILISRNTYKANLYFAKKKIISRSKNIFKLIMPEDFIARTRKIRDHITLR